MAETCGPQLWKLQVPGLGRAERVTALLLATHLSRTLTWRPHVASPYGTGGREPLWASSMRPLVPFPSHRPKRVLTPPSWGFGLQHTAWWGGTGLQTACPHVVEGHLLHSGPTNLNITSSKNTFTETSRITLEQISGPRGPAESEHKINPYHEYSTSRYFFKTTFRRSNFSPAFPLQGVHAAPSADTGPGGSSPLPGRPGQAVCYHLICIPGGFPGSSGKIPLGFITCDLKPALRPTG